jgi:arabinose-5-phosphate isomerase
MSQLTPTAPANADELTFAATVLRDEATALAHLSVSLDEEFIRGVDLIVGCAHAGGNVLLTGLGKSGLVGAKIAATLSSLGIPAHSVHPSEAFHGDLGRFRSRDIAVCISSSGETGEVVSLASVLHQDGLPIISITAQRKLSLTSLERLANVRLRLHMEKEAGDGVYLAPTTSTTLTMAIGDALALTAARRMNFTRSDFQRRHPGGTIGELLRPITQVLRTLAGKDLPLIPDDVSVYEALALAERVGRRPGAILLIDRASGALSGLFTDGDLRRLVRRDPALLHSPISTVMTRSPRTLPEHAIVEEAVKMFREFRQDEIPVVTSANIPVGILDVQDLIAMRLVD